MPRARFNATVLNAHPDNIMRAQRTIVLRQAGFEVIEAATGAGALSAALEFRPDLVLLPPGLPDRGVSDVCCNLKEESATASIMVVQSSENCTPADRADALETGADALLSEPVDSDELVATINALVRIRWCREQLCARVDELERQLRDLDTPMVTFRLEVSGTGVKGS